MMGHAHTWSHPLSRSLLGLALLSPTLLGGCSGDAEDDLVCGEAGDTQSFVITGLYFGRRDDNNEAWGFNLDDHVSDFGDDESCGNADLVSPDGQEGIDSAFSGLVPALEATEASAVEDLIQDSIANGNLLLLGELSRVDDPMNDECVDLRILRGTGDPLLGTDGLLLGGQTFAEDTELAQSFVEGIEIVDGVAVAGPFAMDLPLQVLDVEVMFSVDDTWMHIETDEDGNISGYFGGAVPLEQILAIVAENDLGDIRDLVTNLVSLAADMHPDEDGVCQSLSIVFEFEAAPAFVMAPGS